MKKARRKLTLHRETIATLNNDRLNGAAGGGAPTHNGTICYSICKTVCCPSNYSNCVSGCANCDTETGCVQTYTC